MMERYFINEEKKVVVCKLEDCCDALLYDMYHKGWPGHEGLIIDDVFIGKAWCSPDDTFDAEIGKKIAYKRAVVKLFKAKKRTLAAFIDDNKKSVEDLIKDTNKLINNYNSTISRKENDISKIVEETE